jgi:hypothetical protein
MMGGGSTHIINISRAETFLAGSDPFEIQIPFTQKHIFKLIHPCTCKEECGVILWNEGVAGPDYVGLFFKKFQKFITNLVCLHRIIYMLNLFQNLL